MPQVKPLKGVIYNKAKIKDISSVVCPPYDVIPQTMQDELYLAHPCNVVRLELGRINKTDNENDNRYTRAKKFFEAWIADGLMVEDDKPSFYIYSQKYKAGNKTKEQVGFMGLMGLDNADKILPHENTLAAPKVDRLNLMRSVRANLSPIFVLYEDKRRDIAKLIKKFSSKKALLDAYFQDVRHRIWKMDDPAAIKKIEKFMQNKDIFIADGHHRYEVSRMYSKEICNSDVPEGLKEASKYVMVYFVAADEKTLTVLPTHRVIKDIGNLTRDEIIERLGKYFDIKKRTSVKSLTALLEKMASEHIFGMYLGGKEFYALRLKDARSSDATMKDKTKEWKRLDVSILHLFILQNILKIRDDDENIDFIKSADETADSVNRGDYKIAFFLNPTKVSEIKKIAKLGERMPRKSTYFYPKPVTGLVINKH